MTNRLLGRVIEPRHLLGCGTVSGVEAGGRAVRWLPPFAGAGWGRRPPLRANFLLAAKAAFCLARKRFYAFDPLAESKLIRRGARRSGEEIFLIGNWIRVYFPKWIPRVGKISFMVTRRCNDRQRSRPNISAFFFSRATAMFMFKKETKRNEERKDPLEIPWNRCKINLSKSCFNLRGICRA